uniref:Uncharacterized protein n=1 Tax=Glossina palpalis gambiensis TaxID=67801 RepID=A0A1B0BQD0_9MUSC
MTAKNPTKLFGNYQIFQAETTLFDLAGIAVNERCTNLNIRVINNFAIMRKLHNWAQNTMTPQPLYAVVGGNHIPANELAITTPKPIAKGPPIYKNLSLGAHTAIADKLPTTPPGIDWVAAPVPITKANVANVD